MADIPSKSSVLSILAFLFRVPITSCRADKFGPLNVFPDFTDATAFQIIGNGWNGVADARTMLIRAPAGVAVVTSYCFFEFIIPPEYVAGSTITLRIRIGQWYGNNFGTHNIKIQAFKIDDDGQIGALIGNSTSNFTYDFSNIDVALTSSSLAPGDRLVGAFRTQLSKGGGPDMQVVIGDIAFLCDIHN